MPNPMIPTPLRRTAAALLYGCVGITALLGFRYRGQTQPGWWDAAVSRRILARFGESHSFHEVLVLGNPIVVAMAGSLLCLGCLSQRRWRAAVLVSVAVPGAAVLAELILKPMVHRTFWGGLAFPSGHATGVFVIAVTTAVLLINPPRPRAAAAVRGLLAAAALATAGAAGLAVLAANTHYPTDVVGGATVATAVVLATAFGLDRLCGTPKREPGRIDGRRHFTLRD